MYDNNDTGKQPEERRPKKVSPQDFVDYEVGGMEQEEIIIFFQKLIDTGMCWSLQGHYGRMAQHLIDGGWCSPAGELEK
jgi:hypothetical protein